MKINWTLFAIVLFITICSHSTAMAQEAPTVYKVENTGADCSLPILPTFEELPTIRPLTDPFEWSDGSGRIAGFNDWRCRRAEIAKEIQHYEIGEKPLRPDTIKADVSGDTLLTINVTKDGKTLTLTAQMSLPEGDGPFPAIIGVGRSTGSLPPDLFIDRGIATLAFNFSQIIAWEQKRGSEPINTLYPDLIHMGAYSAWSWGVSRLIDGLEIVQADLNIDLEHLGITGCSFAGKMALFAGAFDERIALTIAQESGGGGAAAWRVSETLGNVETLGNTSHVWFMEDMFQFSNSVGKLPHDHHELMAMVAPRALLVLGNPDYEWLAEESGYVSCTAAHEVWKAFGIADRFGYSIVAGHPHCNLPDEQRPEVEAFIDKFLLDDATANTEVTIHPYETVNHKRWYEWWGTGDPAFPDIDTSNREWVYLEVECGNYGSQWHILPDKEASNGGYATVKAGQNSAETAPTGSESVIIIPFTVSNDTTYYFFGRVNAPSAEDDSFWIKIDDGDFVINNGLVTRGWQWVSLNSFKLQRGDHTMTIAYREDGALFDKLAITNYIFGPTDFIGLSGMGDAASNSCTPVFTKGGK